MNAFTKLTADSIGGVAAGIGKGIDALNPSHENPSATQPSASPSEPSAPSGQPSASQPSKPSQPSAPSQPSKPSEPNESSEPQSPPPPPPGPSLLGTLSSGASALLAPARDATSAGLAVAHSGLDMGTHVATGTVSLAGTALGDATSAGLSVAHSGLVASGTASLAGTTLGDAASAGLAIAHSGLDMGTHVATGTVSLAGTALGDATSAGLAIGTHIARSGLDMGTNVATGTVSLAGTALGGVVAAAAETSGAVFQPVNSGIMALNALDRLGEQGLHAINGVSLGAVRKVNEFTTNALNMRGKTPTFFDPDADGVVRVPDTVRGLVLLGLGQKYASYVAYVLHTIFSYSTSDSWVPSFDTTLPIRVKNMTNTRWGTNWGNFERLAWVDDVEIDKFFMPDKQLSNLLKLGRQAFGALLILFEWGTTWPFYIPPVPVNQIPFADDIGSVVRKAILPTIISNFKKARAANPVPEQPAPPLPKAPEDPVNMPGQFAG